MEELLGSPGMPSEFALGNPCPTPHHTLEQPYAHTEVMSLSLLVLPKSHTQGPKAECHAHIGS